MNEQESIMDLQEYIAGGEYNGTPPPIYLNTATKAIQALEKEVPKKPEYIDEDANYFECPGCGEAIYSTDSLSTHKYCLECGQKIDWSVEE